MSLFTVVAGIAKGCKVNDLRDKENEAGNRVLDQFEMKNKIQFLVTIVRLFSHRQLLPVASLAPSHTSAFRAMIELSEPGYLR